MSERSWSVNQLVSYLKGRLERDAYLQSLYIKGELSNFVAHSSGHFYFTLKDEQAQISCVMFSTYVRKLKFRPKDGMKVMVKASISIYEKRGTLQLYCTDMIDDGLGNLHQRYEELKAKLYNEGYFNEDHKKPLPAYPFDIALISGNETAARSDVLTTLNRRWPVAKITEYPALVQGMYAADSIVEAINKADSQHHDVILLVRGGGSLEDLWSFNEEKVVKAIYNANTPIVSGVGHEVDFTLADFVSDKRANTPTGAAEIVAPKLVDVKGEISHKKQLLVNYYSQKQELQRTHLNTVVQHQIPKLVNRIVEKQSLQLMMNTQSLLRYPSKLEKAELKMQLLTKSLQQSGHKLVQLNGYQLQNDYDKMKAAIQKIVLNQSMLLKEKSNLLNAYSPTSILERGYAIVEKENRAVTDSKVLNENDTVSIRLAKGKVKATVVSKE